MASEIETMGDWNEVIARCCPCMVMPVPQDPILDSQSMDGYGYCSGYGKSQDGETAEEFRKRYVSDEYMQYSTVRYNRAGDAEFDIPSGWSEYTITPGIIQAWLAGKYLYPTSSTEVTSSDPVGGGDETEAYSGGITTGSARNQTKAKVTGSVNFEDDSFTNIGTSSESLYFERGHIQGEIGTGQSSFSIFHSRFVRYRWLVPANWEGNVFKITWDVIFVSNEWDEWNASAEPRGSMPSPPTFVEKDKTVTWKGPGSGNQDDPSWRAGQWYRLDPPNDPGTHRIVNIRYEATPRNPYGTKPQITGDGYDPANP